MTQFDSYWSEEAWRQYNDPAYQERLPRFGLVTKWPEDGESVTHAKVNGESYYWRSPKAFSNFVGNRERHGKTITDIRWIGETDCIYAAMVAYIAGEIHMDDIPQDYQKTFSNLYTLTQ